MLQNELQGRRIAVIGSSGSGKSTLARTLAVRLDIRHVELDAINWGPGWTSISAEDPDRWGRLIKAAVADGDWVTDGNYSKGALPCILPLATDIVWLDYSRTIIMTRVIRRSLTRALTRHELWPGTGNRETVLRWLRRDHPIRWTWDTYRQANERRVALFNDTSCSGARKHRHRTPAETREWLARILE